MRDATAAKLSKEFKKDRLAQILAELIEQIEDESVNSGYMYTEDFTATLLDTLSSMGVEVHRDATYDIRVKLNMRVGAHIPSEGDVREAVRNAFYDYVANHRPCVFPVNAVPGETFEIEWVREVDG